MYLGLPQLQKLPQRRTGTAWGKECMGNTLYIGSLQSEVYFCIYEKDYEQYKKHDIPIADAEVKNRFEIRLKMSVPFTPSVTC